MDNQQIGNKDIGHHHSDGLAQMIRTVLDEARVYKEN